MVKVLILNHRGVSVDSLVGLVRSQGAKVDVIEPEVLAGPLPVSGYDGFMASGGYLKSSNYRESLQKYSGFFSDLERPFLGICLGMRILGHCYGARTRRIAPAIGDYLVSLEGFPLCPELSEFLVYENHKYELMRPLPTALQDFTAGALAPQAVKVAGKDQYAVQFHPEVGDGPAQVIVRNFVSVCSRSR